jgi:hypothetical protein
LNKCPFFYSIISLNYGKNQKYCKDSVVYCQSIKQFVSFLATGFNTNSHSK